MIRALKHYGAVLVSLGLLAGNLPGQDTNQVHPVDLPTVLRLAGAQNLEIQMARERLREAEAQRSSALERFFPWIAPGVSYHRRDGVAQAVPDGFHFGRTFPILFTRGHPGRSVGYRRRVVPKPRS